MSSRGRHHQQQRIQVKTQEAITEGGRERERKRERERTTATMSISAVLNDIIRRAYGQRRWNNASSSSDRMKRPRSPQLYQPSKQPHEQEQRLPIRSNSRPQHLYTDNSHTKDKNNIGNFVKGNIRLTRSGKQQQTGRRRKAIIHRGQKILHYTLIVLCLWTMFVQYNGLKRVIRATIKRRRRGGRTVGGSITSMSWLSSSLGGNVNDDDSLDEVLGIGAGSNNGKKKKRRTSKEQLLSEIQKQKEDELYMDCPQNDELNICFVTSIFAPDIDKADKPSNVRNAIRSMGGDAKSQQCGGIQFYLFTNLGEELIRDYAPGWNILHYPNLPYKRYITQSRWGKFQAYKDPTIQSKCLVVYYMDGYVQPYASRGTFLQIGLKLRQWQQQKNQNQQPNQQQLQLHAPSLSSSSTVQQQQQQSNNSTTTSEEESFYNVGLAQVLHPAFNGQSLEEIFDGILERKKDIPENTNITLNWIRNQTDMTPETKLTYYLNKYFAYDPHDIKFQQISDYFWKEYSTENGSWRDQPMWAYTLYHYNITPMTLTTQGNIERGGNLFKPGGIMGWGGHVYG